MALIADLIAKLKLDSAQFSAGLATATAETEGFASKAKLGLLAVAGVLTGALAGGFYALKNTITEQTAKITELVHTSERLGVGVGPLQELQYAANLAGMSTDQLNTSLKFMEKNIGNVGLGLAGAKVSKYFDDMGISAKALLALPIDQQFLAISAGIKTIKDPAEQVAIAIALLGKSGTVSLGLLKSNVTGTIAEFKALGVELTDNQAKSVEQYGEDVKKLDTLWEGFKNHLTVAIIPKLEELITWIESTIQSMGGMGPVATIVGQDIVQGLQVAFVILQGLKNAVDIVIIAFDALAATALETFRIATLGLADLASNIADKQHAFEQDARDRIRSIAGQGPQQQFDPRGLSPAGTPQQQQVNVNIQADQGLIATVTNSAQNQAVINQTVNNAIGNAARGEQR